MCLLNWPISLTFSDECVLFSYLANGSHRSVVDNVIDMLASMEHFYTICDRTVIARALVNAVTNTAVPYNPS